MDSYEKVILVLTVPFLTWLGWLWQTACALLMVAMALGAGLALWLYQGDIARADQAFLLKYLFSSQSAILWMCALFVVATFCYWLGLASPTCRMAWYGIDLGCRIRWSHGHAGALARRSHDGTRHRSHSC
jgi:hypothetical protein